MFHFIECILCVCVTRSHYLYVKKKMENKMLIQIIVTFVHVIQNLEINCAILLAFWCLLPFFVFLCFDTQLFFPTWQEISAWHLTVKQKRKRAIHTSTEGFRPGDFINLAQLEAQDNYALNFTYFYRINAVMSRVSIRQEWEQPKKFLIWVSFSGSWSDSHIIE